MGRFLLVRNPVFGRFWVARTVSYVGSEVTLTALVLYVVYDVGGGGGSLALLLLAGTAPSLLGPIAGTVVDRVDARRLMILCDLGQAALIGAIAFFLPPFPVLLVLVFGASVLSTVYFPAGRGAVPALVSGGDLTAANALLGTSANVGFAAGPALGGLLFAGVGARGALTLDALTFLVSAAFLVRLPALPAAAGEEGSPTRFVAQAWDGLLYVVRNRTVLAVTLGLFLGIVFLGMDDVARAFLVRDAFGAGETAYGVFVSAHGVGMILGPLLLLRRGGLARLSLTAVILLGLALEGFTTLFTGLAPFLGLAFVLRVCGGVANGVENVAMDTLIQKVVPRPMLGRVFGAVYGSVFLAEGLAYAAGGLLLEATSARVVYVVAGAGTLLTMLLVYALLPRSPEGASPRAPE